MKIFDAHCDALLKLWEKEERNFTNSSEIDANYERLMKGGVKVQCFALFAEPDLTIEEKYQSILKQIELFQTEVINKHDQVKHIKDWKDIAQLNDGEIGAVLTLEGVDCIGDNLTKLNIFYQLGVKSVGLTWNQANLCADGVGEPRGAGLTLLGKELVQLNNEHKVWTDVAHLSEKGFWDVMELADYPVATHCNARALCDHRRNLKDEQILELVKKDGWVGLVWHPIFLTGTDHATMTDCIRHIDHLCSLGVKDHILFGSDFDGISVFVKGLENASKYPDFIEELLKHFSEDDVKRFAYGNFERYINRIT
ncbi:dipeptidase [Alkalihalobacterium chitinilyticum]|uniref:Dipeptidase n=1 Tax=Alkalihalobacterium chitinilyticum TaxID=2980103 RepID=A0ABT5VBJ2_9BACI|nr:dipeptidase [Alkalihalobacterium chitinilyticum]MDE5412805.1 dipeptidase [Alkalihalobacterium chitinilyticum]